MGLQSLLVPLRMRSSAIFSSWSTCWCCRTVTFGKQLGHGSAGGKTWGIRCVSEILARHVFESRISRSRSRWLSTVVHSPKPQGTRFTPKKPSTVTKRKTYGFFCVSRWNSRGMRGEIQCAATIESDVDIGNVVYPTSCLHVNDINHSQNHLHSIMPRVVRTASRLEYTITPRVRITQSITACLE